MTEPQQQTEGTPEAREPVTAERVRDMIEDAGYETRRYSGRHMNGRECLALVTDETHADTVVSVMERCARMGDAEDVIELARFLRGSRSDSLGRETIVVYLPDVDWADCSRDDESDDEDHDCPGPHCCSPGVR